MVLRVKEAFSFDDPQGVPITLRVGALLDENDPRVKGHERFLEPASDAAERTSASATETATAGPGELRATPFDETAMLRQQATDLGVKVDKRWGADKLRQEIENAKSTSKGKE